MATLVVVEDLAGPAVIGRGGHAMYVLHWLHAFKRSGHDVLFVEFLDESPEPEAAEYFNGILSRWWALDRSALISVDDERSVAGIHSDEVARWASRADALITLAAHYRREPWPLVDQLRPRVLIDTDPGYTHLWAAEGEPAEIFGEHDHYFTVGANVGTSRSALPTAGIDWHPTWNPVVMDWWPATTPAGDRFTTVGAWRDYGYLEFEGRILGPKAEEYRHFIDLPQRSGAAFELALSIDADDPDVELLRGNGWTLRPPSVAASPEDYRRYLTGSLGEFACAKGGYVGTRSGWFSDRSACYLAAGRPVVLQATGFEDVLPTGQGLFAVRDVEEAAHAVEQIRADYSAHSIAARSIAETHFDGVRVATRLLERADVT